SSEKRGRSRSSLRPRATPSPAASSRGSIARVRTSPASPSSKPRWQASGLSCSRRSLPASSGPPSYGFVTIEEIMNSNARTRMSESRHSFIGGSDARIIMGADQAALVRLWHEKRGEAEREDLSGDLIVQLGAATEDLNRSWYERNTGRKVGHVQRWVKHSAIPWMAATLDGIVEGVEWVFEAKFMLPWSFSEEAAAEKYMAQVQHNMWV